jgi:transposase-like protein
MLWFNVIWQFVSQKTGSSAMNLKEAMGFGSYQTTWCWLHKLRRAMIRPGRDRLNGEVEIDETFIGGEHSGKRGRGAYGKTLVVVAAECLGKKCGRVRFRCIPEASALDLLPFISDFIAPGSKIITDGWAGYNDVGKSGYKHEVHVVKGSGRQAHDLLPHVHLLDSLVKRWINGTHQGNIDPYHLPFYLDEFAFRFNRRLSSHRGKLFFRLIQQALMTTPHPYKELIKIKSKKQHEKNLLSQLIKDLNTDDKQVWALKKIKDIDPIVEQCVRNLCKLRPLKYIKITEDSIIASNQIEGSRDKIPITKPYHPTAIGIHLIYDCQFKTLEFFEINSPIKGWGEEMVKAALNRLPSDWQPTVVMDWSDGFWDKMKVQYNNLNWLNF